MPRFYTVSTIVTPYQTKLLQADDENQFTFLIDNFWSECQQVETNRYSSLERPKEMEDRKVNPTSLRHQLTVGLLEKRLRVAER